MQVNYYLEIRLSRENKAEETVGDRQCYLNIFKTKLIKHINYVITGILVGNLLFMAITSSFLLTVTKHILLTKRNLFHSKHSYSAERTILFELLMCSSTENFKLALPYLMPISYLCPRCLLQTGPNWLALTCWSRSVQLERRIYAIGAQCNSAIFLLDYENKIRGSLN